MGPLCEADGRDAVTSRALNMRRLPLRWLFGIVYVFSGRASPDVLIPCLLTPEPFGSKVGLTALPSFRHARTHP